MLWILGTSLTLLSLPIAIGFVRGFVEALHAPRPRLRLVTFDDNR
jgi:hypothetical protein